MLKNLFKKASEKHFNVDNKDIGKRRVISIFAEWVMLSWMWSMFYFQYLKAHLSGLSFKAIGEKSVPAAVIVAIIIFGIYLIAEYMLFNISRYHVNFVLTGRYSLEEKDEKKVKKKR